MKHINKITITLLVIIGLSISLVTTAQAPPPPPGHGQTGNQTGGNAPIGGGLFILIGIGAAYCGKKIYDIKKRKSNFEC